MDQSFERKGFLRRHPIIVNIFIITIVAICGVVIAYLSLSLFTKHGQKTKVPTVVGMSYTKAIEKLHAQGFKIEIRDSLYLDNVKPGYVIEQYPDGESTVKPGRRIFLYINAVNPKQVIVDPAADSPGTLALAGLSKRAAMAMLEEEGFTNIKVVYKRGADDRVVRLLANGKVVKVMEKVPINASIILEVNDNSYSAIQDSISAKRLWLQKKLEDNVNDLKHDNQLNQDELNNFGPDDYSSFDDAYGD